MIEGPLGASSCVSKPILPLVLIHPTIGMSMQGLGRGGLILKTYAVPTSVLVSLRKQNVD